MKKVAFYLLAFALASPFVAPILLAFGDTWFYPDILPPHFGWRHWQAAHSAAPALVRSLLLAATVALLAVATAFPAARVAAFHPQRDRLMFVCYLPYVFSPVVYGYILHFFFLKMQISGSFFGLLLAHYLITFPFAVILLSAWWNERLRAMEQLTLTLGGSLQQAWLKVIWPLSKGMLMVVFFQAFLISWFDYGIASVIGLGQQPLLTQIAAQFIQESNPHLAAVSALLLSGPPLLLLWINKKMVFRDVVEH